MGFGSEVSFLRYWGSHFKSTRQIVWMASNLRPLVARGWRCTLVLEWPPKEPDWLTPLDQMGVRIACVPRPGANLDWRVVRAARRLCRQVDADIVVCDNMHTSPLLGAVLAGVPVRCWFKRSMNAHYEQMRRPTLRERVCGAVRLSCALATRVFAVSEAVKSEMVGLGFPEQRIVVQHDPRLLGDVNQAMDRSTARQRWDFGSTDVVIGTVGHAVPVKGWDILLEAFTRVALADDRARLLLVGSYQSPGERPFYRKLTACLDTQRLAGRLRFAGHQGDVASALRAMDVFVMPSRSEGFCCALIEALEAGLPCVSTRVGIAETVVQPDINGYLVSRGDVHGLAEALLKLVRDNTLRARFAQKTVVPPCIPTLEEYAELVARDYETLLTAAR